MCQSMLLYKSHVSSALSQTRLVSVDFARIIRHCDESELPPTTISVASRITSYHLKNLMLHCSERRLGNDVRQQGECTTIRLACYPSRHTYMVYPAVISVWMRNVCLGLGSTWTDLSANKEALDVIHSMVRSMPAPGSLDYKPDDPEYKALRAQVSRILEAFSQFLSTPAAIGLISEVDEVFYELRDHDHGEKSGLLSPPLIRAMSGYLDAYKKARGWLHWRLEDQEEWITTLYRNLKPDDSGQVRLLSFCRKDKL